MRTIEQIECDHDYAEVVIHIDMSWGQKVRVLRCEYCGDTRVPADAAALPEPMLRVLGLPGPRPAASRATRGDRPSSVEAAWLRLAAQHRKLLAASLSARADHSSHSHAHRN
jgi:hypothetical protein